MASLSKDGNGWRLTWDDAGKRRTLRMGKANKAACQEFKAKLERLIASRAMGTAIDSDTATWVGNLPDGAHSRLFRVGLVPERVKPASITLGKFLREYISRRQDAKPATREVWGHTVRNLIGFFGENRDISTIDVAGAEDFKAFLLQQNLAKTTASKRLQFARQFFKDCLKRGVIKSNPFRETSSPATFGTERQRFVTREEVGKLLAVANPDWQLIICLSRYGGLRCPSEVLSLRWDDVNFATSRMIVQSPKTERYANHAYRELPVFPELRGVLQDAYERAEPGAEYVVGGTYRKSAMGKLGWLSCNLRQQFGRIIRKAGLVPWPRPFHAMRSTRETELAARFPIHTVVKWLGNSPKIAIKHYLMVSSDDFDRAIQEEGTGTESGTVVARNPAQQPIAMQCKALQSSQFDEATEAVNPCVDGAYAAECTPLHYSAVGSVQTSSGEDRIRTCGPVSRSPI